MTMFTRSELLLKVRKYTDLRKKFLLLLISFSGSPIDVKGCIKVLREQEKSKSDCLLNALRYTTRHVNDETTPKSVKSLLFDVA